MSKRDNQRGGALVEVVLSVVLAFVVGLALLALAHVMGRKRGQGGQALVEFGMTVVLFVGIVLALLTFAQAFLVVNMITHAARDGARIASTWPSRGNCGVLTNTTPIGDKVKAEIATAVGGTFTIAVSQNPTPRSDAPCGPSPQTPTVQVNVSGCVPYLFPILPKGLGTPCPNGQTGFNVNRTVVFHDEGV